MKNAENGALPGLPDVEALLRKPYWIADILPCRVPKDGPGQYFAVEGYYRRRMARVKERHTDLLLKLNCYRDLRMADVPGDRPAVPNPPPEEIGRALRERPVFLLTGEAMILSEPEDTHLTVFNPDEDLLRLLRTLCAGEGLYLWQPPEE